MEDERVDEIIDKLMEGPISRDPYSREPEVERIAARTGAQTGKEEKPQTYEDWVKSQPKPRTIGLHKTKK